MMPESFSMASSIHGSCEFFDVRTFLNQAEVVANPLHQSAGDGDASLQGVVSRLVAKLIGHGCQQTGLGIHFSGAGIHEQKAACAVGVLRFARLEAGLAHQGGLLVAEDAGDSDIFYRGLLRKPVILAAGANFRQHRGWNSKCIEELLVPRQCLQIHQLRAAGVSDICEVNAALGAARQVPDEKGVNVAEDRVAGLGQLAHAFYIFENPSDFQAAEIRCKRQPGLGTKTVLPAGSRQFADVVRDPRVLPDKSVGKRLAGFAVPNNGSLPLVGDTNRGQVLRLELAIRHRFRHHFARALPDFFRVVLNPSRFGINLLVFFLGDRDDAARAVKHDEPSAGCPLINCADVVGQGTPPEILSC